VADLSDQSVQDLATIRQKSGEWGMTPDEYLQVLRKKLKGFTHLDKTALVEEIASHIESGEDDLRLGKDITQRRQKVMSELGSPEQMAKGFHRIYQPGGLINYLLIAIPYLLNLPINLLLVSLMPKYHWADVRLVIIFHLILVAIGLWRRSTLLTVYWLADLAVQLMGVLWVVRGHYGSFQTVLWFIVLAALIFQLGRMVWQNRHDLLIVTFALVPILIGVLDLVLEMIVHGSTYSYQSLEIFLFRIWLNTANYLWIVIMIALFPFFMVLNRNVRWLSLAIFWLLMGLSRYELDYRVIYPPNVYYLWIILPLAVIYLGWFLERSKRLKIRIAT
jgi:hypothetical protein